MHITTGLNNGGAEGALTRIIFANRDNEHEVVSLLGDGAFGKMLRDSGVPVFPLDIRTPAKAAKSFLSLITILRRQRPDVVQCWMYHANLFGSLAAMIAGCPKIIWNLRTIPNEWLSGRSHLIINSGARLSKFVPKAIVCAGAEVGVAHANRGYAAEKLIPIGNGVDTNRFMPDPAKGRAIRTELGIGDGEWLIGRIARDVPQKDHQTLFVALAELNRRNQPLRCILAGHGMVTDNEQLRGLARDTGVDHLLIYAGHRPDVEAVANALNLFVSSSRVEGFPNAIAEAMACGVPVVATKAGASEAIVGDVGDIVDVGDGVALAEAIANARQLAMTQQEVWRARKAQCRRRIESNFSMHAMVAAYEGVWRDAVAEPRQECALMSIEQAS